jgi:hypothetical protein
MMPAWLQHKPFPFLVSCQYSSASTTAFPAGQRNESIFAASLPFDFVGAPGALPTILVLPNFAFGLALYVRPSSPLLSLGGGAGQPTWRFDVIPHSPDDILITATSAAIQI